MPEQSQRFARSILLCLMALFLCACQDDSLPRGVVATVNGEPIMLHSVQSLLDSRSAALGIPARPSLEDMKSRYGQALGTLIAHALARQELAARKIEPDKELFQKTVAEINEDYGPEQLDAFLQDASLRKDDWQDLIRDYLALENFKNKVLHPGIKVSLDEIRQYYQEHQKEFELPASLRVCFLTAAQEWEIRSWCADLANLEFRDAALAQCLDVTPDEIPNEWQAPLKKLAPMNCLPPVEKDGEWRSMALLRKDVARKAGLAHSYALIERILMDQKREAAYNQWLERKLQTSVIKVTPDLIPWLDPAPDQPARP